MDNFEKRIDKTDHGDLNSKNKYLLCKSPSLSFGL